MNIDFITNLPAGHFCLLNGGSNEGLGYYLSLQHTALVHKVPRDRAIFMSHHTVLVGHLRLD